jgi:hypothetical protein
MWPRVPCFERVISALFTVNVYTSTPTTASGAPDRAYAVHIQVCGYN